MMIVAILFSPPLIQVVQVKIGGGGYHNLTVEVSDPDKLTIL